MLDFLVTGNCFCGNCDNDVKLLKSFANPLEACVRAYDTSKDSALIGKFLAVEIPIDVRIRFNSYMEPEDCKIIARYIDGVFSAVKPS